MSKNRKKLYERARRIASMCILVCAVALFALPTAYAAGDVVSSSGEYVSDYANILSNETEAKINESSAALEKQGKGAQIVVVTVPTMGDLDEDEYALAILREWGVGSASENNGVVILVSTDPRKVKIEVGYGLEGRLNDGKLGRILDDYAVPFMREDDFDQGVTGAYVALFSEVCAEYGLDPSDVSSGAIQQESEGGKSSMASMIAMLVMIIAIASLFGRRNRGGKGGPGNRSGSSMWPLIMYGMGHHRGRSRGIHTRGGGGGFRGGGGGFRGGGGSGGGGGSSRGF